MYLYSLIYICRSSTIGKQSHSPPSESLLVPKETPCTSNTTTGGICGTSPANFSFLIPTGSATTAAVQGVQDGNSEIEENKNNFEDFTKKLSRSHSTSILTDLTKHIQRQNQESEKTPENTTTLYNTPASSLNQTGTGTCTTPKAEHPYGTPCNNKDEDSKKSKYRRCSSLKSGKTPPGTPGRQKIVR